MATVAPADRYKDLLLDEVARIEKVCQFGLGKHATYSCNSTVKTKSLAAWDATIFETDPNDLQDGISGVICTPGMGEITKSLSDVGICSNAPADCNLDSNAPEVRKVIHHL